VHEDLDPWLRMIPMVLRNPSLEDVKRRSRQAAAQRACATTDETTSTLSGDDAIQAPAHLAPEWPHALLDCSNFDY
jgi:hypothetical protein